MAKSCWFTEEMWISCDDLFSFGRGLQALVHSGVECLTDRKLDLFEVACARRVASYSPSCLLHQTIELAEIAADAEDGPLSVRPLTTWDSILSELDDCGNPPEYQLRPPLDPLTYAALNLAHNLANPEQVGARIRHIPGWSATLAAEAIGVPDSNPEHAIQIRFLRDIFGNPFRPVTFAPEWRTEAAVGIAAKMYDSRDFGNMPVLADALQDAGCEHADVLSHCRGDGPHVRGCWVVDLVLGKA